MRSTGVNRSKPINPTSNARFRGRKRRKMARQEVLQLFGVASTLKKPTFRFDSSRLKEIELTATVDDTETRVSLTLIHKGTEGIESRSRFRDSTVAGVLDQAELFHKASGAGPPDSKESASDSPSQQTPESNNLDLAVPERWRTYVFDSRDLKFLWVSSHYGIRSHQARITYSRDSCTSVVKVLHGTGFGDLMNQVFAFVATTVQERTGA